MRRLSGGLGLVLVAIVGLWLGLATPAATHAATVFSAVGDFSTTTNSETSTWSYRFSNDLVRDGVYGLLTTFDQSVSPIWTPATSIWNLGPNNPGVGVNNTGSAICGGCGLPILDFQWPSGTIWMHPGGGGLVVVSWLSPAPMVVDIAFSFADMDPNGGDGIQWFVDRNSTGLATGAIANAGAAVSLTLTAVPVNAGDRIHFIVAPNSNHSFDSTTFTAAITVVALSAPIDIKPGAFPNSINPKSKGVVPVAILTTDTFDATTVDPTTVLFGPIGTEAPPVHSALEDVDGDGDIDLILHFKTQDTGIACGDTSASLTGETFGGDAIEGSDSVNTVGCN